jgi:hypothetical protein
MRTKRSMWSTGEAANVSSKIRPRIATLNAIADARVRIAGAL